MARAEGRYDNYENESFEIYIEVLNYGERGNLIKMVGLDA